MVFAGSCLPFWRVGNLDNRSLYGRRGTTANIASDKSQRETARPLRTSRPRRLVQLPTNPLERILPPIAKRPRISAGAASADDAIRPEFRTHRTCTHRDESVLGCNHSLFAIFRRKFAATSRTESPLGVPCWWPRPILAFGQIYPLASPVCHIETRGGTMQELSSVNKLVLWGVDRGIYRGCGPRFNRKVDSLLVLQYQSQIAVPIEMKRSAPGWH